jgi:hypothetical protein
MPDAVTTMQGAQVLVCAPDGAKIASEQDAVDLVGEAFQEGATVVVVPVERLAADFFQLKTRLAGLILQKFVNYRRRIVILGDIADYVAQSKALHDFVYESNKGTQIWFLNDLEALEERLQRLQELERL